MAVTTTLQDGAIEWFGRGSMIRTNQSIHTHSVINGSYPYQVTNRIAGNRCTQFTYIVPFLVTVGTKQAVVTINRDDLHFYIIGLNANSPTYTTISTSSNSSQITGFSNKLSEYDIYLDTGMPYPADDSSLEANIKLRSYYYENSSLFVTRYESPTSAYEVWITPDGYIQVIGDLSSNAKSLYTTLPETQEKDKDIKCSDTNSYSGFNLCPYRVARKTENTVTITGTAQSGSIITIEYDSISTKITLDKNMDSSTLANFITQSLPSSITSVFNVTTSSSDEGNCTLKFVAKSTGYLNIPWVTGSSGTNLKNDYKYGCNTVSCSYYDTSRSSCYYGGYTTNYIYPGSVVQHIYSNSRKPQVLFKLNEDGTITKFDNKHIPSPVAGSKKILGIQKGSDICRDGLFLYNRKLTPTELGATSCKAVSFNVDGQSLFGHFIPDNQTASKAEILSYLKLAYGSEKLKAVNYASTTKSLQSVIRIVDKQYNNCYYSTGSTSYYWNYTEIYSFYEPLANVVEIRCRYYADTSNDSYTELPNNSFPYLYFCYRTTFDDTNASSSWSGVSSITLTTPVYDRPHLVIFKFTSPITIAQWCIIPQARGSGYSTNASYGFKDFNVITDDGLSLNYNL